MKMQPIAALVLFLLSLGVAQAEVYRWVDSQGRVQYSDQPPPGVNAQKVTAKPATGAQCTAGTKSYQEQDQEFRKRRVEEEEKARKQAAADQQTKAKEQNCTQAKNQLAALQGGGRFSKTNEKGEREVLDEKGIEAAIVDAKRSVAEWCK